MWAIAHRDALLFGERPERTPLPSGLPVEKVEVRVGGRRLSVWDVAASETTAPGRSGALEGITVLYMHGTDTSLNGTLPTLRAWHELGYRVIAFDYSGFGESTAKPSGEGLVDDSQAVIRWMGTEKKIRVQNIVVHGHSLGSGVAAQLAARQPGLRAVVLESPYSTVEAAIKFSWGWWFPARIVTGRDHKWFDSVGAVARVGAPVLVAHGTNDVTIPISQGRRVAAKARCSSIFEVPGAGHNDLFPTVAPKVVAELAAVVKKCGP